MASDSAQCKVPLLRDGTSLHRWEGNKNGNRLTSSLNTNAQQTSPAISSSQKTRDMVPCNVAKQDFGSKINESAGALLLPFLSFLWELKCNGLLIQPVQLFPPLLLPVEGGLPPFMSSSSPYLKLLSVSLPSSSSSSSSSCHFHKLM